MSLLVLLQKSSLRVAALWCLFLVLLLWVLLLLQVVILMKTYKKLLNLLQNCFSKVNNIRRVSCKTLAPTNIPLNFISSSYTLITHIQITTIFVNNIKIILRSSKPMALTKFPLLYCSYIRKCHNVSVSTCISYWH